MHGRPDGSLSTPTAVTQLTHQGRCCDPSSDPGDQNIRCPTDALVHPVGLSLLAFKDSLESLLGARLGTCTLGWERPRLWSRARSSHSWEATLTAAPGCVQPSRIPSSSPGPMPFSPMASTCATKGDAKTQRGSSRRQGHECFSDSPEWGPNGDCATRRDQGIRPHLSVLPRVGGHSPGHGKGKIHKQPAGQADSGQS